jgi:hypothetical protein
MIKESRQELRSEEGIELIKKIRASHPDRVNKFMSIISNKGIDVAREMYDKIDPGAVEKRRLEQEEKDKQDRIAWKNRNKEEEKAKRKKWIEENLPHGPTFKNEIKDLFGSAEFNKILIDKKIPPLNWARAKYKTAKLDVGEYLDTLTFGDQDAQATFTLAVESDEWKVDELLRTSAHILSQTTRRKRIAAKNKMRKLIGYDEYEEFYDYQTHQRLGKIKTVLIIKTRGKKIHKISNHNSFQFGLMTSDEYGNWERHPILSIRANESLDEIIQQQYQGIKKFLGEDNKILTDQVRDKLTIKAINNENTELIKMMLSYNPDFDYEQNSHKIYSSDEKIIKILKLDSTSRKKLLDSPDTLNTLDKFDVL